MLQRALLCFLFVFTGDLLGASLQASGKIPTGMAKIPAGAYLPFYQVRKDAKISSSQKIPVKSFWLDRVPVTQQDFLAFVQAHPEWEKSRVPELFADQHYLQTQNADESPVTSVSWFAAKAYCAAQGKRLPSLDEWEFAAQASEAQPNGTQDAHFLQRILDWYSRPTVEPLPKVSSVFVNYYGIHDMHGLVWEWVSDFNSIFFTDDTRSGKAAEQKLFCAGGAVSANDVKDYAAFMRYAFRASLKANYSVKNLGFRCAQDEKLHEKSLTPMSSWTTQDGKTISLRELQDKPVVLTMVYTSCQWVCPLTVADLKRIESSLGKLAANTRFVLVSFDPAETSATLSNFAQEHQLSAANWILLRGNAEAVRELAAVLGVQYKAFPEGGFSHSNIITVLNTKGEIAAQHIGLGGDLQDVVRAVQKMLN